MFKCKLVNFVFSFKGKDLIVSVLAKALAVVCSSICYLDLGNSFLDLSDVTFVDTILVS